MKKILRKRCSSLDAYLRGMLFENMVVMDLIKNQANKAKGAYLIYAGKPIGGTEDIKILNFREIKEITHT